MLISFLLYFYAFCHFFFFSYSCQFLGLPTVILEQMEALKNLGYSSETLGTGISTRSRHAILWDILSQIF